MNSGRLFKIKSGKKEQWHEWCKKISTIHREHAVDTLREEKIMHEAFIIFSIDGQDYTIGLTQPIEGETEQSVDMDDELNQEHRAMKRECLELPDSNDVEIGYSLYNL